MSLPRRHKSRRHVVAHPPRYVFQRVLSCVDDEWLLQSGAFFGKGGQGDPLYVFNRQAPAATASVEHPFGDDGRFCDEDGGASLQGSNG